METINILHISDLHFLTDDPHSPIDKVRDGSISDGLRSELTYKDSKDCFFGNSLNIFGNQKFDLIACTGDLGYQNSSNSIKIGAEYIGKLADRLEVPRSDVIVSPGNHDLNRDAEPEKEFEEFSEICSSEDFIFPKINNPAYSELKGIPVIALNTCLGGTEHALHGLPDKFWDLVKKSFKEFSKNADKLKEILDSEMPEELKYQIQSMDIPAIGKSQLESVWSYLRAKEGNFSIILCHHNPVPTPNLEVRPYSSLVDSGPLLYGLMENKRRVFILHGHTHCETTLTTHTDDQEEHGFITSIGSKGLFSSISAAVANIQIIVDSHKNFLTGIISGYSQRGHNFLKRQSYQVFDMPTSEMQTKYQLDNLEANKRFQFSDVASKLGANADEDFAENLLRLSIRKQINITNIDKPLDKWQIDRIG